MHKSKNKVLTSWSTGKDGAYALYQLIQLKNEFEIIGLLTTVSKVHDRTSIHGVRRKLLEEQAKSVGLPLYVVEIPSPCSIEIYDSLMKNFLTSQIVTTNVTHIAFGDLFLENIRQYRETKLSATTIKPLFPLWRQDTKFLAHKIIDAGFKAVVTCIDPKKLDPSFVGRVFDKDFLRDLPSEIDPCGENGEFHTFVYDAPMFSNPIQISVGKTVVRNGFMFADIAFLR
jgi:uncharacterized protein (TIGR00290 family)